MQINTIIPSEKAILIPNVSLFLIVDTNKDQVGMKKLLLIFLILSSEQTQPNDAISQKASKPQTLKIGNLALPSSQQVGPLLGFGQNINDKGDFLALTFMDYYQLHKAHYADIIPAVMYSFDDSSSIFVNFPMTPSYKNGCNKSSGLEDFFVQLEYCFVNEVKPTYINQATVVGKMTIPSGSTTVKNPATGYGAPAFFLGTTFNQLATDWYFFFSIGGLMTLKYDCNKRFGNQLIYQCGIGKNIGNPGGAILTWILELDGYYTQQDRCGGIKNPDTGSNIIYLTPSIWYSTERLILQFGIPIPIIQHQFGDQPREYFGLAANIAWKFN